MSARRTLLTLAAALGCAAAPATAAVAGPASAVTAAPTHLVRQISVGESGLQAATSANWAGYALLGSAGSYRTVTAAWTQPVAHCTSSSSDAVFWVGIDGANDGTVEQDGTGVHCAGGRPSYYAWHELYPKQFVTPYQGAPVSAGDKFTATATFTGGTTYSLRVTNTTKGWTKTSTGTQSASRASVEVVAEAPSSQSGILPLTNFGTVRFTGSVADGSSFGSQNPVKINMQERSGPVKASTSALAGGTAFTVTWHHS